MGTPEPNGSVFPLIYSLPSISAAGFFRTVRRGAAALDLATGFRLAASPGGRVVRRRGCFCSMSETT